MCTLAEVIYIPARDVRYVHAELVKPNPRQEFRGFEAVRGGYAAAWFRLRGDYNDIGIQSTVLNAG